MTILEHRVSTAQGELATLASCDLAAVCRPY